MKNRRLWAKPSFTPIERKRYTWASIASIAVATIGGVTAAGAGTNWFGMGGGGDEEQQAPVSDPMADIQARLQEIASGVAATGARRAESIRGTFGQAREKGLGRIQENIHAQRGFGETSLEPMYNTELLGDLATREESALSSNEVAMTNLEAGLLGKAGALGITDPGYYESMLSSANDGYGSDSKDPFMAVLGNILSGYQGNGEEDDLLKTLANAAGSFLSGGSA